MKTRSRNLITVILALLCAVAVAIGIGFVLPKSAGIVAKAAAPQSTFTKTFEGYYSLSGSNNANTYSNFTSSNSNISSNSNFTTGSMSITTTKISNKVSGRGYISFKADISVPAYTEYKITYEFTHHFERTRTSTTGASTISDFVYFGHSENGGFDRSSSLTYSVSTTLSSGYSQSFIPENGGSVTRVNTVTINPITYTNDTNTAKTCTAYFGFYTASGYCGSSVGNLKVVASLDLNSETVTITKLDPPSSSSNTSIYDGNAKTFNYSYYTTSDWSNAYKNLEVDTTVEALDYDGGTIASSTYSIGNLDASNVPMSSTGIFTATEAGKYKLSFNLTSAAISNGICWFDGSTAAKTLSFEIKRKSLTLPSVTAAIQSQTYDPSGCNFGFANYDSATMTATPVSSGITWNGTQFHAVDVGEYTVKFGLTDKKNYVWDTGSGTADDQEVKIKITKKQLDIPVATAAQQYTGSTLTFVLTNFNGGTYIKVDDVGTITGANGNTATGAGGIGISDTTDTFEATKVDKYTVNVSLRDTTNYEWTDGTDGKKAVEFEITRKDLLSASPVSSSTNLSGAPEWEFGDGTVTMTVTDDRVLGENPNILFYYDSPSNTILNYTVTGNTTVVTMPSDIGVGPHTFHVELNGDSNGDNVNYKFNPVYSILAFTVTSGTLDPANFSWTYTKDNGGGAVAGGTSANDGSLKLPFGLKSGSASAGIEYELSIQIPAAYSGKIEVDATKYVNGYQTRSGSDVNPYTTIVALKSRDTAIQFEVGGRLQNTIDVAFDWEIEKGTFDLSGAVWEYSLDGTFWTDYDVLNPPQYNDGNYITVRLKQSSLPAGLTFDGAYAYSDRQRFVDDTYVAEIQTSDFYYDPAKFNAPSGLSLNWEIAKKNLYTAFKNVSDTYANTNGSGTIVRKELNVPAGFENYIEYKYYRVSDGTPVTLADIKAEADPTSEKKYKVEAYISTVNPSYAQNYEVVTASGDVPSEQFKTGSLNESVNVTLDGVDISLPISVTYDGNTHFDSSLISMISAYSYTVVTDFTVSYYTGTAPVDANKLAAGVLPKDAGDYCIKLTLGSAAEEVYVLINDWFTVKIAPVTLTAPTLKDGVTLTFNGEDQQLIDSLENFDPAYMEFASGSVNEAYHAGSYRAVIKLKDEYKGNYVFVLPTSIGGTKKPVKGTVAGAAGTVELSDGGATAALDWTINKY
ncbi:MAG: hypothetical protein NC489_41585, partial [Ruminococcus flavefaciens]|nr:hypothetical protein [Ruminococcus flavefaciens]